MPSVGKWCGYFNHKAWLTISGLFVCHQEVSGVVFSTARPGSPFWPLCEPSACKWLFQPQGLAHHCGLCVYHQRVSGVVISTTRPGSPLWLLCVPSVGKWCGYFNQQGLAQLFWPLCVPSACKWCGYFNHKAWLTILAFLCAISG